MPQERANPLVQLRADDVLEFAGLTVHFLIFDAEGVLEETLGQAMAPHHIPRTLRSCLREAHIAVLQFDQAQIGHAREQARNRLGCDHRKLTRGPFGAQQLLLRGLADFAANPDLFEQVIEANFVVARNGRAAVGGIRERASHG